MKIKVLGCSNSWTERYTSCYLVNDNILMDCGCDAYKAYIKTGKDFSDIRLFLITHFHADHVYGLNVFLTTLHRYGLQGKAKPIIAGPKGIKNVCERVFETSNLIKFDFSPLVDFYEVEDGIPFEFDGITITPYKLDHGDVVDFGYVLNKNGKAIGYTGDTTLCPEFMDFVDRCDICIMNISRMETNQKHLGLNTYKELLAKYPDKKLLATHCDENIYSMPFMKDKRIVEGMIIEI